METTDNNTTDSSENEANSFSEESIEKVEETIVEVTEKPVKAPFWERHFLTLLLLVALIVALSWGFINNQMTKKTYNAEISSLQTTQAETIQNLRSEEAKKVVATLALAVQNGMLENNMAQVNTYFLQSLENIDAQRILLINHITGKVVLSTNKKDEGKKFEVLKLVKTNQTLSYTNEGEHILAATPIIGQNTQLGVLVIELN